MQSEAGDGQVSGDLQASIGKQNFDRRHYGGATPRGSALRATRSPTLAEGGGDTRQCLMGNPHEAAHPGGGRRSRFELTQGLSATYIDMSTSANFDSQRFQWSHSS